MKTKHTNEFPYNDGVQVKAENANTFDKNSRVAEAVKEELDATLWLNWLGDQFYNFSEASKRKDLKKYKLKEQTPREKEAEARNSLLQHLQVKPNPLKYANKIKVYFNYAGVGLGMLVEFFIYQSIAENAFGMGPWKSYLVGFLILLFTKFVQVAVLRHIKQWIKENNLKFRSIQKTLIFVFVGLIFLNAMMMGITNLSEIEKGQKIKQIEYLSESIAEAEEFDEDTSELEAEHSELQAELGEEENGFLKIAKFISVAFIGLLSIGAGAVLFVIADLYNDALKLQKKLQDRRDRQAELQANFGYFLTTYDDLVSLQKEIMKLFGQKHFLEKLLSPEQAEALKIKTENNNSL